MSTAVVEVGPVTVRGPGTVPTESAMTAVACIDDALALIDDAPVSVDELWADVIGAAVGLEVDRLTLVFPTWWTVDQVARVRNAVAVDCAVTQRVQAFRTSLGGRRWSVVEIAMDLVVVARGQGDPVVLARCGDADALVRAVVTAVQCPGQAVIDAPVEVAGAVALGRAIADRLRDRGVQVSMADSAMLRREFTQSCDDTGDRGAISLLAGTDRGRRGGTVTCAALIVSALCAGTAVVAGDRPDAGQPMAVLVEGRVGLQIPLGWTVQRVTDGPGSARVQVVSASDPDVMIHLTQSGVADGPLADTLRQAFDEQPAGAFVDFNPVDRIADRPVLSYREVRDERQVRWAVLVDGPVRIAIGCQSAVGRDELVRRACETAIRSAHAVR
ncbi:type VII secretion-associated protein [Mycolicibacterium sp. XJ870]